MSQLTCKNCGNEFEGKFCNNCGQKASADRLTYKSLVETLMHGFLHVDKGFFYTIKMLFINPGELVVNYINCKRVKYFQPFPLLIILSAIYGLLHHWLAPEVVETVKAGAKHSDGIFRIALGDGTPFQLNKTFINMLEYIINHLSENYAFMNIFIIPPFILATKIAFRKAGAYNYNFVEYLFGGAYLSSLYIVISILFMPFELLLKGSSYLSGWENITWIVYFLVTLYFFYHLFEGGIRKTIKRTVYTYVLYFPFLLIYVIMGVLIAVLIAFAGQGLGHLTGLC